MLIWKQLANATEAHPIFNCQMGRGRTTTGMVITVLVYFTRHQHLIPSAAADPQQLAESMDNQSMSTDSDISRGRYLAGEYKIIMNLLQVLDHGKQAKRILDAAIDGCDAIQNLRTAIYDFKLKEGVERGLNYLLRYFFLISFAEFLLEIDCDAPQPNCTFAAWLAERREITNMISRRDQIDFS